MSEYEKEGEDHEKSKPCSQESIAGFKLFGFHIDLGESAIKKSKSLNNLQAFGNNNNDAYADDIIKKSRSLDNLQTFNNNSGNDAPGYKSEVLMINKSSGAHYRKRGTPWTEEEHRLFLMGLDKLGRGDWKGIANKFVRSRKPTQIASHAQKYFLRLANKEKKRRRSSVFDIPHPLNEMNEQSQAVHGSSSDKSPESSKQVFNLAASMNYTSEIWAKAIVPSSERPPLSPMKCNTITEFLEAPYVPKLSSYNQAFASQSILMPTLPWGPVFNFAAPSSALTLPHFSGGLPNCGAFVPQKTQLNDSSQVGPKTSNDELNLNIGKLTLM